MAIETTFTIKSVSVEQALKEAESKVDRSAKKMDSSLNQVGGKGMEQGLKNATKGMDAVSKAGGKVGGTLKNLTQGIAGMMSPIGMVTAGITAVIALVTKLYEHAKEKAKQLVDTYIWEAGNATKNYEKLKGQHSTDAGYLKRLETINSLEHVDNATKIEAARIIEHLSKKYGDLGLSIDSTTGKIVGLTKATKTYAQTVLESEIRAATTASIKQGNVVQSSITQQYGDFSKKHGGTTGLIGTFNPIPMWEQIKASVGDARFGGSGTGVPLPYDESQWKVLVDQYLPDAVRRYVGLIGLEEAKKHPKWGELSQYYKAPSDSADVQKLLKQRDEVQEMWGSKNSTPEQMRNFEKQFEVLTKMVDVQRQIETAYEMQGDQNFSTGEAQHWRKIYEEARSYYDLLQNILNMYQFGNDTGNIMNPYQKQSDEHAELDKQIKAQMDKRAQAYQGLYNAEERIEEAGMTQEQRYDKLLVSNSNWLDAITQEELELGKLKSEYERLLETEKTYDQYKDENGIMKDDDKMESYLALQNELKRNELERLETETRITQAQTEQLGVQAKLKAIEEERNKAQREKLMQQMKESMKWLFSNVLGDMKERTNALTQRGGYLSNVNTMNALQVNKQILNTVITANNYLANIKQAIANVGKI